MSRRERQQRRRRNHGSPLLRVIALTGVLLVCALAVGGLAIAGWVVNVADSAPNLDTLPAQIPGSPSQVFASNGQSLGYIYSPTLHTPVAGSAIPQRLKDATIAIEDRRFWHHGALDYQGILRAAIKDVFSGGSGLQGASTLTMQLVNNVYMPTRLKYRPRPQVQDHPGQAGRAAGGQAHQGVDPQQLSQRCPVRDSRRPDGVRRRCRVADLLRQAGLGADARASGAARRAAAGAVRNTTHSSTGGRRASAEPRCSRRW